MIIQNILDRGEILNVSGPPRIAYQHTLLSQIALLVANGSNVLGFATNRSKVLLVDRKCERLHKLSHAMQLDLDSLTIEQHHDLKSLDDALAVGHYDLVVIHRQLPSSTLRELKVLANRYDVSFVVRLEKYLPCDVDITFARAWGSDCTKIKIERDGIETFIYADNDIGYWRNLDDAVPEGIGFDLRTRRYVHFPTGVECDPDDYHHLTDPRVTVFSSAFFDCAERAKIEESKGGSD